VRGVKRLPLSLLLAAIAFLVILPGPAGAVTEPEYAAFVGCDDLSEDPTPAHECKIGDFPAAYFESSEDVEYDVCVEFPNQEVLCDEEEFAEAGVLYASSITTDLVGPHYVAWFLSGTETEIGFWAFEMKNPPPPPVVTPVTPVITQPAVVPGPSAQCLEAQRQIKKLKRRMLGAGGLQKAKLRAKLKKARTLASRVC
jgi:hypothetical protein